MSKLKRICPVCHSTFVPNSATQKYCSTGCSDVAAYEHFKERKIRVRAPRQLKTCEYCGKSFTPKCDSRRFCSRKCYGAARKKQTALLHEQAAELELNPPVPSKSLADWIREATECNLDYGSYRGLIDAGKSFDELKALASSRSQRVHSHSHKIIGGAL